VPQTPFPAQGMPGGPGQPGSDRWYTPPAGPGRRRKRPRWLIPVGGAAAILVIVVVLVLALSPGSPKTAGSSSSQTPSQTATAGAPSTVRNLLVTQLRDGDCLTGANLNLNLNTPWPKLAQAVPCSQSHTAEVFYANNNFWSNSGSYPGDTTVQKDATAACDSAFQSYVGISYEQSMYSWADIVTNAASWTTGSRGLHCVAYYKTSQHPGGETIQGSIKGTAR
jgi:Septum formation